MPLTYTIENPNAYGSASGDYFGASVVAIGQYVIVGASREADAGGTSSGKVYVFNANTRALLYTITNPNAYGTSFQDYFGEKIAVIGENNQYIAVGCPREDSAITDSGKVYIFNIANGSLVTTLENPDLYPGSAGGDGFGYSISGNGTLLFIGAPNEDDGVTTLSGGTTHVYDTSVGYITHSFDIPSGNSSGGFGQVVAAYGDIGASANPTATTNGGVSGGGRVLVYDLYYHYLIGELTNPAPTLYKGFGLGLAMNETYIAVSALYNSSLGTGPGIVFIYDRASLAYLYAIENPNTYGSPASDAFGARIVFSGDYLIISSIAEKDANNFGLGGTGAIYIFRLSTRDLVQTIRNPNTSIGPAYGDGFGGAISVYGSTLYAGAYNDGPTYLDSTGKVYAFSIGEGFGLNNGADGVDLSKRYVTKGDLIDRYPSLMQSQRLPTVWIAGAQGNGQGGLGDTLTRSSPVQIPNPGAGVQWKQMSMTGGATGGIRTDGTLWCMGYNQYGQMGNGTVTTMYSSPVQAYGGTNWIFYESGTSWTHAGIQSDGTLWTWGYNAQGLLGQGTTDSGDHPSPAQVSGGGYWASVSIGDYAAAGIKNDGTLWTWGIGSVSGCLGLNNMLDKNTPTQVGSDTNWATISVSNGTSDSFLLYGINMMAIKTDGSLWTWGRNNFGQLGTGNIISYSSPVQVLGGSNWKQVSNNDRTVIALKKDGTLWSWGYDQNATGGLNVAMDGSRSTPTQIGRSNDWKFLASVRGLEGARFAIKTNGTLWGWGQFPYLSQFQSVSTTFVSSPVQIGTRNDWKWVAPSQFGFVGITDDSLDGF